MTDPCRYCVAPERYPGCHDHCEKLKAHRESDEYKKLCESLMVQAQLFGMTTRSKKSRIIVSETRFQFQKPVDTKYRFLRQMKKV